MKAEVKELRSWLKNNMASDLAAELGYKSSLTVHMWVRRDSIPEYQVGRVLNFIRKKDAARKSNKGKNQKTTPLIGVRT